jgi:hypothetical protein
MRFKLLLIFLLLAKLTSAQEIDTTLTVFEAYDSLYEYSEYEDDSLHSMATYTHMPSQLPVTEREQSNGYTHKKFSKTEWKNIIGKTNYTEEKVEKTDPSVVSDAWNPAIVEMVGYAIIIGLIIALLVFMLRAALRDSATIKNTNASNDLLAGDQHLDDIDEDDLEKMLQQALAKNDVRMAVRIYYIKLLKHLYATGYIVWKKDKTNRDYASELSSSAFIRDFRKLMIAYEIIWYGERTPSAQEFEILQLSFTELYQQPPVQPNEK